MNPGGSLEIGASRPGRRHGHLESPARPPHRLLTTAAWLLLAAVTVSILARGGRHDWRTGDTIALVNGLPSISNCLSDHVFRGCNSHGGTVSAFALLQILPAYVLHLLGVAAGTTIGALAWLNSLVVVGFCAVVLWWSYRRAGRTLAILAGLLLIPGMLIPYSIQSFGEPLATVAFGGVVLAGLRRDRTSPWLALMAFAAAISKDTAAPFVFGFGLAAIVLSGCEFRTGRRSVIWLAIGTAVGYVVATAFNVFRYNSLVNQSYLAYPHATKQMAINSFFGQLVSPNGGIAWFWPGTIIAVVVLAVVLLRGPWSGFTTDRLRIGAIVALASFFGSVAVLALWWQPYGWYAWGPRLLMPVVPAVIVLALATQSGPSALRRWLSAPAAAALSLVAGLVLAPSIGIVFHWQTYTDQVIATWVRHPYCQTATEIPYAAGNSPEVLQTEQCIRDGAWETDKLPLLTSVTSAKGDNAWYWLTFSGGVGAVILWATIGSITVRREDESDVPAALSQAPAEVSA